MPLPILAGAALGGILGSSTAVVTGLGLAGVTGATIAGGAILGGSLGAQVHATGQAAEAAREQARLSNEATDRQWAYDMDLWDMTKERIIADRTFATEEIATKARNERTLAEYKDATNLANYGYQLQIRNREQQSLNNQYIRSNNIYGAQTTMNAVSAKAAEEDELRSLQETKAEASFQLQEDRVEQMQAEGRLRARGAAGRSASKVVQATMADHGRHIAMLNESLEAADRNTKSVLKAIQRDKTSADLSAYAAKMLDPGVLPDVVAPFQTPLAEYLDPRELTDADFGPRPVPGARVSGSAASSRIWANTITGIAGQAGSLATKFFGV
tara:strand:+ start:1561 stop:2544 length:984 start_codon:yes stop_codon:yes gene_type:complete